MDDENDMMATLHESQRKQRDVFQENWPRYSPPPWATEEAKAKHRQARLDFHGVEECRRRFPDAGF